MAQVIFMRNTHTMGAKGYQNGDPVDILEDGADVGRSVDPARNPNSIFRIVDVAASAKALAYSKAPGYGPDANGTRSLVKKRAHTLAVNMLPVAARASWNTGVRFSLTEAEYRAAMEVKP